MGTNQMIELPHEVDLHLRKAKAHIGKEKKYVADADDFYIKSQKAVEKSQEHRTACGNELIAAREALRKAKLIPGRNGKGNFPLTWTEVLESRICDSNGFSVATANRYMQEVNDPDAAAAAKERDRVRKERQREKAKRKEAEDAKWEAEYQANKEKWAAEEAAEEAEREAREANRKKEQAAKEKRDEALDELYEAVDALVEKFGNSLSRIRKLCSLIKKITI